MVLVVRWKLPHKNLGVVAGYQSVLIDYKDQRELRVNTCHTLLCKPLLGQPCHNEPCMALARNRQLEYVFKKFVVDTTHVLPLDKMPRFSEAEKSECWS